MPANSLFPAFVKIEYESAFGPHSMIIPTVEIAPPSEPGDPAQFILPTPLAPVDVETGIGDYVDIIKGLFPTTTNIVNYTAYTMADAEAVPVPVESALIDVNGTDSSSAWHKATQQTMTWRTTAFGIFKIVFLDSAVGSFDKINTVGSSGVLFDLDAFVKASTSFIRGRDGGRPATFLQLASTLNEKLRRSYRMN